MTRKWFKAWPTDDIDLIPNAIDVITTEGEEASVDLRKINWNGVAFWSPTPAPIDLGPPGNPFRWRKPDPAANWFLRGDDIIEVQIKSSAPRVIFAADAVWDAIQSWRVVRACASPLPDVSPLLKACGAITLDVLAANPGLEPIAKEYARLIK